MDALDKLAQKLVEMNKVNRNPPSTAPRIGIVISIAPLRIQYGDSIVLEYRHLIVGESLMTGYKRTIELSIIKMAGDNEDYPVEITFYRPTGDVTERITGIKIPLTIPDSQNNKVTATVKFTDGLQVGDEVILQPDESLKLWYVVDRVWKEE